MSVKSYLIASLLPLHHDPFPKAVICPVDCQVGCVCDELSAKIIKWTLEMALGKATVVHDGRMPPVPAPALSIP